MAHHHRPNRIAKYTASGRTVAKSAPSAIGCSADPSARIAPARFPRERRRLLQQRDEVEMLERRPAGSRLDHCQPRENRRAHDDELQDGQHLRERPDDAYHEVEDNDKAQRQSQRTDHVALVRSRTPGIGEIARYESERVEEHRPLETTSA